MYTQAHVQSDIFLGTFGMQGATYSYLFLYSKTITPPPAKKKTTKKQETKKKSKTYKTKAKKQPKTTQNKTP